MQRIILVLGETCVKTFEKFLSPRCVRENNKEARFDSSIENVTNVAIFLRFPKV